MKRFYLKKGEKVQHIQAIVSDLEMRLLALQGDQVISQLLAKETKEQKIETLKNHVNNLNSLHEYVDSFFEAWITEQNQLNGI